MIKESMPLSISEAYEYIGNEKDSEAELKKFVKKFTSLKPEKAKEIRKNIGDLGLLKVKQEHISKIIDILPENLESLNKIFTDVGLDEDEAKKILDTIKQFK